MGKRRFRFSDMIPNAWFYKLKDMSRSRSHHHMKKKQDAAATPSLQKPHISLPRYFYYFTTEPIKADKVFYPSPINPKASDTHFPDPSRKSSKKNIKRRTIYKPSPKHFSSSVVAATTCSRHTDRTLDSYRSKYNSTQSPDYFLSESEDDNLGLAKYPHGLVLAIVVGLTCSTKDIIIDLNGTNCFTQKGDKLDGFEANPELELPPILTKPAMFHKKKPQVTKFRALEKINAHADAHQSLSVKIVKEERFRTQKEQRTSSPARKSSSNSTGIRLSTRANSPRIASKKLQAFARKSPSSSSKYAKSSQNGNLSESFIVVKSSVDPLRDFRDSMVEMIVENNLRTTKDLEDLLACYLSLNSNEYQDFIIKAFEQIWFDRTNLRL